MNEIINIEHNNERVLTTEQLAQVYECETKRISENFKRNEERFEEGKHYFKLDGDALRDFKITNPQIADNLKFAPVIMLWTRRGGRQMQLIHGNKQEKVDFVARKRETEKRAFLIVYLLGRILGNTAAEIDHDINEWSVENHD